MVRNRTHIFVGRTVAAATFALAAGCSGNNLGTAGSPQAFAPTASGSAISKDLTIARNGAVSPVSPMRDRSIHHLTGIDSVVPDAAKGYLYIGQFSGNPVQEYHLNNKRNKPAVCSLGGTSINGIATDRAGNLWVPNGTGGGQGYTQEYAPNCGKALLNIADPNGQPADVGFDRQHHIYILNIFGAAGAAGQVDVYDGTGKLLRTLTYSTFNELIGIATDSHDNIFVSNRDASGDADVVEFPHGKMPGSMLGGVVLGLPGAPQFDRSDNLIITDWNNYTLNVYAPPYNGTPVVTPMQGLSLWCPLNRQETHLFCADLGGSVDVYVYPSGTYAYSFTNGISPSGFATGAATDPAAPL
ncbi:MAG TPA: hypothetical protein VGK84_10165 [Candidatus Tumulicola sp.]